MRNECQSSWIDPEMTAGESGGGLRMDVHHVREQRELRAQLAVHREVAPVVRRLVVQGPDQLAAAVQESLELAEKALRRPPRRGLVALVAIDRVLPVEVEDHPAADAGMALHGDGICDRAATWIQIPAGMIVEQRLVGIGCAIVWVEHQGVGHGGRVLLGRGGRRYTGT